MECNQFLSFYPDEEDDDEKDRLKTQREMNGWVEEQRKFDKPLYCTRNNDMVRICFKNVLYVL